MLKRNLNLYSIMALAIDHVDELCEDIRYQYENGITNCVLFRMTLVPEGTPPVDKAKALCERYDRFKEKLDAMGIPSGILVQASIGHGYKLSEWFPYTRYVNMTDGKEEYVVCPYDEGFHDYITDALRTVASHKPCHIMIDDDFRLMYRGGGGCACERHMSRFNELAGTRLTREEFVNIAFSGSDEGKRLADIFIDTQKEAVLKSAKVMRAAIDSVDPKIPASFCTVGNNVEFAPEIAEILAGEGNPKMVRIHNGRYCAVGTKNFSADFFRAGAQIAKLKDKVDVILAETDTCPHNRYSTSASSLHTHFTGSLLEGAKGAKQWITRARMIDLYEPESGTAYRKILSKYARFYEELAEIEPTLKWRGCRIPVLREPYKFLEKGPNRGFDKLSGWANCVFERFGIPMYFSPDDGGVLALEGDVDIMLTDDEILKALHGPVLLSSDAAKRLIARGFGKYLGVAVNEWQGETPSLETIYLNNIPAALQVGTRELVPLSDKVESTSGVYHAVDGKEPQYLFPGATIYKNELGGIVFVFSGTPKTNFSIGEAFSFLCYSRKLQLLDMLLRTDDIPAYYPHDEEIYLRAADIEGGGLFVAVFNLGLDPIEELELVIRDGATKIEKLMPNGTKKELAFTKKDGKYVLDTPCNTLEPVILFIN